MHQREDLGRWVRSVRLGWEDKFTTVPQWMYEQVNGIEPVSENENPQRPTQADEWAVNYQAAHQFYAREGHLRVPRKHVEQFVGADQEERELRLGALDRQPAQQGRHAVPGAGRAAVRDRNAVGA
ncbi:hypothetical protein [Streptomyces sp. NBC_00162]|uniref:hypothetical protein n=1 Tax=Streptomyces sp. NBC_00162 TaxID=2903629 RepID=UPI003A4C631C